MRVLKRTTSCLAIFMVATGVAEAQELRRTFGVEQGLLQTTIIEDPFSEPRVPVTSPQGNDRTNSEQTVDNGSLTASATTQSSTTQSQRSAFDRGADIDPLANSALANSGEDSIAREARERERLSILASTGNLPPVEDENLVRRSADQVNPFQPIGIRRGNFILLPELEVGGVYSSNVGSISRDGPDDGGLRLAPRLSFQSDWERHSIGFTYEGEHVFYNEFDAQNANNFSLAVNGRLDIRSTTTLDVSAGFGQSQSNSADFEVPDTAQGLRDDQAYNVTARLTHQFNRVIAQVTGSATWFNFGDVDLGLGEELNSDRDYVTPAVGLRVGYQMSEAVQPFVEVTYSPRIHNESVDRNGLRRDSQGIIVRSGVTFNDGSIWSGEVAARYEIRDYEDAGLANQQAIGVDANVNWNVSDLTTVTFTALSQTEETSDPLVSGATTQSAGVAIAHQFRDNLAAEAGVSLGYTDFGGLSDEVVVSTNLGVAYAINPNIELIAGYTFTSQDPGEAGGYDEHRLSSGARFKL